MDEDLLIVAAVNCEPTLTLQELRRELSLTASLPTIRRRLHAAGLRSRIACQRPRVLDREKTARLQFARDHLAWGAEEWKAVVFSDESTFVTRWDQQQRVWRIVGTRYEPRYTQQVLARGRCGISVWGAVTHDGLGPLHRIEGTLTSKDYLDIIQQVLLPFVLDGPFPDGLFVFQHDRSPVHTSKLVRATLDDLAIMTLQWPPKGADINIIENIWGLMKRRLSRRTIQAETKEALWAVIEEEWAHLKSDRNLMPRLYASLPGRIKDIVEAHGTFTRH